MLISVFRISRPSKSAHSFESDLVFAWKVMRNGSGGLLSLQEHDLRAHRMASYSVSDKDVGLIAEGLSPSQQWSLAEIYMI